MKLKEKPTVKGKLQADYLVNGFKFIIEECSMISFSDLVNRFDQQESEIIKFVCFRSIQCQSVNNRSESFICRDNKKEHTKKGIPSCIVCCLFEFKTSKTSRRTSRESNFREDISLS